jgi:outer membrane autotransporter protein
VIGLVDYLHSAAQGGGVTFQTVINAATLTLFGAHHRPLMDFAQPGRTCAWATGDFAGSGNASGDRRNYLGEMGLCHDLGSNIRVGLGAGYGGSHQDLSLGGRSEAEGFHVIGEIDVKVPETPILFSVTGYYADWNVEIARAYMNGANIDISRGKTDARTWALRGRIDLQDAVRLGPVTLSPFAAYTHARVKLDGYTEDGGAFDAVYQDTIDHVSELRLGSAAALELGDKARLRLSGEWVRRLDNAAVTVVGFESAVGTFAPTAALGDREWGRIGADIDVNIGKGALLSLSTHRMLGDGQDGRLGGSVSLRIGF